MAKLSWGGLGVDREEKRWFGMQGSWQEGLEVPGEESMEKSFWLYGIAWEVENGKGRIVQNGLVTGAEILKVLQLISRIWGLNSGPLSQKSASQKDTWQGKQLSCGEGPVSRKQQEKSEGWERLRIPRTSGAAT